MGSVKIIKASAGSGKTHTLASEYISLLLPKNGSQDHQAYKHILAVTFTNKATREMKERIIDYLYKESKAGKEDSDRAREMLSAILHDYSQFSVSTIDRFFQTVMRSFAREIGQYASYGVELDTDTVLQQAVDGIFESLDEPGNESLLQWLLQYSLEVVNNGGKWDVSKNLKEIAQLFMKEDFRLMRRDLDQPFGDRETLRELDGELHTLAGDSTEDSKIVQTALQMRSELYRLGIFSDLYRQIDSYLRENNLVLLSESNEILNRIIDGSDTPFIYEKVGLRFDHFMLDEFQDTSQMQWLNFLPLLRESLSRGNDSLIVGDIKQSIYRWRNSDLNLLASQVQSDLEGQVKIAPPLNLNWRSSEEIVNFNNSFFSSVGELLGQFKPEAGEVISRYYEDCVQQVARDKQKNHGHVHVEFINRKIDENMTWRDESVFRIKHLMKQLRRSYSPGDIAFLVRTNKEGLMVTKRLLELGYKVVTEESLKISSAPSVARLTCLLRYAVNPADSINLFRLRSLLSLGEDDPIPVEDEEMPASLYERCDRLLRGPAGPVPDEEALFVYAFLDEVLAFMSHNGSDLAEFMRWWDESGCKKSVSAPDSKDSVTVMTVHKAKGLDFEVVVLPFLDEPFAPSNNKIPYIWTKPVDEPFCKAGLVPFKAKSDLAKTIFDENYYKEMTSLCVDAVNTAYVAMTRAVSEMYIFAPKPKINKNGNMSAASLGVASLLYQHLQGRLGLVDDFSTGVVRIPPEEPEPPAVSAIPVPFVSVASSERLKLRLRGADIFSREEGIVNHDILSRINTAADIAASVREAVARGEVPAADEQHRIEYFSSLLSSVASRHWFDGTYKVLNEVTILEGDKVHRPDRVLLEKVRDGDEKGSAVVIDYKFGAEQRDSYHSQVRRYVSLLRKMGFRDVQGFIWYCNLNEVVEI